MKRLIAVFILALPALAQQEGQLSLSGTVVNAKTGEPIRRALVSAVRFGARREEIQQQGGVPGAIQPIRLTTFTDSGGVFHFTGLPTGNIPSRRRSRSLPSILAAAPPSRSTSLLQRTG